MGRTDKHGHRLTGPHLPLGNWSFCCSPAGWAALGNSAVSFLQPGAFLLFRYQLETVPKMPTLRDLTGRVQGKGDGSGKKGRGPAGCWQGAAGFPSTASGGDQN